MPVKFSIVKLKTLLFHKIRYPAMVTQSEILHFINKTLISLLFSLNNKCAYR